MPRKTLRRIIVALSVCGVLFLMADALGVFDQRAYDVISHGNHSHYAPLDLDTGVGRDACPMRPPETNEYLSVQCQMIRMVNLDGVVHHVPEDYDTQVPISRFPTRVPDTGERISPQGQWVAPSSEHNH